MDPNRIGVYGHSAGAHLALMLGVSPADRPVREDSDCGWDPYSSQVTAVGGGSAPTYLPSQFGDSQLYSPSTYISDEMLPLLLVHGTEDRIVPVDSVDNYVAKVEAAGSPDVTYHHLPRRVGLQAGVDLRVTFTRDRIRRHVRQP